MNDVGGEEWGVDTLSELLMVWIDRVGNAGLKQYNRQNTPKAQICFERIELKEWQRKIATFSYDK